MTIPIRYLTRVAISVTLMFTSFSTIPGLASDEIKTWSWGEAVAPVTHYRTAKIDGVDIFYREAGPDNAPVVLLLHGFPTSSHMFRNLIPALSARYHVIAPDYPGFGHSSAPDHNQFAYTFAHYADLMNRFTKKLDVKSYAMYLMDYGAPIGYRLALDHPERVSALIIQNGNAYNEGFIDKFWDPVRAYWADGSVTHRKALEFVVKPETTKFQYTQGVNDVSRIDPDNWLQDQVLLDRPGNLNIQMDLLYDYRSNVVLYPKFQSFFRERKPPTLIVWGKNDPTFSAQGAKAYLQDLPDAEVHLIDTGHFALEDRADEIVPLIRSFLDRKLNGS